MRCLQTQTPTRNLHTLHQGDSSVEELIQEFEIHGSISGLGDVCLVDHFEQVIHLQLCESIYHLESMLTTWAERKCKASLLDNQWRHFQDMQPKATANWTFSFCSSPAVALTAATASPSSQPSIPAASSVPQPMGLDHTHLMKRDPHHGLCFNCGKPGHIVKVCQGPHGQNVQNVNAMTTLRLTPKDFQFLLESIMATAAPSAPMMPPPQPDGTQTTADK